MDERKKLFETMPVGRALMKMEVPTVISQLITMIYNLADTYFIGRTDNPYMVAAASLSYVLFFTMTALANLFGVGGGSLISRLLGQNRREEAKKVCSFSFYGMFAMAVVYSGLVFGFMDTVLGWLGATANTLPYGREYTFFVVVCGGIPACMSMIMAHLLRSEGRAKYASIGLGLGGVLNLLLDPLFMFVIMEPGQEVMGAAIATMLSNIVSMLFFMVVFSRLGKDTVLSRSLRRCNPGKTAIFSVLAVGLPSAIGTMLSSVSNMVINRLMAGHNDFAVAAMGIVKKLDMLPMCVSMGLCQAMVPLVAYNYSAKNYKRMKSFSRTARLSAMSFAAVCVIVYVLFAPQITRLMIGEAQTVSYATDFLRIAVLATPLMGFNVMTSFSFQAMGKGAKSLFLSSCRQGLVNIPLLFLMNALLGPYGVASTQVLADGITLCVSLLLSRQLYAQLRREESQLQGV